MNYRPPEWVKMRNKFFESHQAQKPYYKTRELDYETGADAMLEELSKLNMVEILRIFAEHFPDRYTRLEEEKYLC